jgi:hypothetical protein
MDETRRLPISPGSVVALQQGDGSRIYKYDDAFRDGRRDAD